MPVSVTGAAQRNENDTACAQGRTRYTHGRRRTRSTTCIACTPIYEGTQALCNVPQCIGHSYYNPHRLRVLVVGEERGCGQARGHRCKPTGTHLRTSLAQPPGKTVYIVQRQMQRRLEHGSGRACVGPRCSPAELTLLRKHVVESLLRVLRGRSA